MAPLRLTHPAAEPAGCPPWIRMSLGQMSESQAQGTQGIARYRFRGGMGYGGTAPLQLVRPAVEPTARPPGLE